MSVCTTCCCTGRVTAPCTRTGRRHIFFPQPAKQCRPLENDGYRGRLSIPRARKARETRAALYYISRDGDDMLLACKERERLADMLRIRCRTISSRTPRVVSVGFHQSIRLLDLLSGSCRIFLNQRHIFRIIVARGCFRILSI